MTVFVAGDAAAQQGSRARALTVAAGVEVRHDSNAARASEARAAARGLQRDDYAVSPTLEIDLLKPLGRNQVSLTGTAAYDFYARNSYLNRERIALAGNGLFQAASCTISLSPSFSRRQSDLGDIAIPLNATRDSLTNVETVQDYAGTAECGDDIGLRPFVGGERRIANNSGAFRRFSNNRRTRYNGGIGYARPTFGKLQLVGGIDDVSYPNRPRIGDEEDGFRTRDLGVRFQREIGANLQGNVLVGHTWLRPRRADAPRFSGITYDIGLVATLADRLRLNAALNRSAQPALQTDAAYLLQRSWEVSATYTVSTLLTLNAGAIFAKRDFRGERPTFGPALVSDRRNTYTAGAGYLFSPRLKFALDVRYQTRDAGNPFYDFSNFSQILSAKFIY